MESIREVDRTETCENCGAKYRRARGAQISVEVEGKGIETRTAAEWTGQLPAVTPIGSAECLVRVAESDLPVSGYGEYLGRVEKFGNARGLLRFKPGQDFRSISGRDLFDRVRQVARLT